MSTTPDAGTERSNPGAFGGLELWCVDLARTGPALRQAEARTQRLSDEDHRYVSDWKDAATAQERLATRIALRLLLERAAGPQWRGVAFQREAHGKPYLAGSPAVFSISHITGLALIGIAERGTIGVDVERHRLVHMREPRRSRVVAAGGALNPAAPLPESDDSRFLQAWVRLEALAKADGGGIGRLLTRLDIAGRGGEAKADWPARAGGAKAAAGVALVADLELGQGDFAAVAAGSCAELPQVRWLPRDLKELERLVG